jgi:threonine synthase
MPALAERFRDRLPVGDRTPLVSLGEGGTPLVHAPRLSERLGLDLWLKVEGANPTGSFKDRGMAIAVARALEAGARAVICASTGNTAASAAAYAARAGLRAVVLVPAGGVPAGKLFQAAATGARMLEIRGSFDQALDAARELAAGGEFVLVNSVNPDRLEGQKTAAFEIVEELGAPDVLALPYGGGGNTCAYARGFEEAGAGMPRLLAGEASDRAATAASAIRIARPAHATQAAAAIERSGGAVVPLADGEIRDAWRLLAESEGVVAELSSAAGLAALGREAAGSGLRAVCVLTGHGLKDPQASPVAVVQVEPEAEAIAEAAR